jgi:hypothetical protein
MSLEQSSGKEIEQRYFARTDVDAARLAFNIKCQFQALLSSVEDNAARVLTVPQSWEDNQPTLHTLIESNYLSEALMRGTSKSAHVKLTGPPMDDTDGDEIGLRLHAKGVPVLQVYDKKKHLDQVSVQEQKTIVENFRTFLKNLSDLIKESWDVIKTFNRYG